MSIGKRFRFEGTRAFLVEKSRLHCLGPLGGFSMASDKEIRPTTKRFNPKEIEIGLPDPGLLGFDLLADPEQPGQALLRPRRAVTILLVFPAGGGMVQMRGKVRAVDYIAEQGRLYCALLPLGSQEVFQ
jgi:hypothetical protein